MSISAKERLRRFFAQFSGEDQVLVPIIADPDAIASAMAVKRLLWRKVAGVTITHLNEIRRTDNLVLIRLIKVALLPYEKIDVRRFTRTVLVDAQPDHHPVLAKLTPDIIIDHHPVNTAAKASVMDIRPTYGATASIMVEYLRAAGIKPSTYLATGLFYAIKTDTSNFERHTRMEDLHAFQFVFRHCNTTLARRIETAEIRRDFLKFFKMALEGLRIRKGLAFVHLGPVTHPDASVQVADFLMRIDAVDGSIVSGVYQRKLTIIFRNHGIRKDAGALAKRCFARWGSAGGHKTAARAEIPIESLEDITDTKDHCKLAQWIFQVIDKRPGKAATKPGKPPSPPTTVTTES